MRAVRNFGLINTKKKKVRNYNISGAKMLGFIF